MAGGPGQRVWRAHFSAVSEEAVIGLTLTLTPHLSPFTLTQTQTLTLPLHRHRSPLTAHL